MAKRLYFFFSSRRRHTRCLSDWSSDVCSSDLSSIYALQSEIDELQKENERHTHQIKSLKTDPMTIEKEAREQLHYARPGEVVYVTPAPVSPQKPANNAAKN